MERLRLGISCISGTVVGAIWGQWDGFLIALVIFAMLDYITGLISAYMQKRLDSRVGWTGILKKCLIFAIVAVANVVDTLILGKPGCFRTIVIFYYVGNEGLSILENCGKIGIPIPNKIILALEQLKKQEDTKETILPLEFSNEDLHSIVWENAKEFLEENPIRSEEDKLSAYAGLKAISQILKEDIPENLIAMLEEGVENVND